MRLKQYITEDASFLLKKHGISKVKMLTDPEEMEIGMTMFEEPPEGKAFLFVFPDEGFRPFFTEGMKFPIDIHFFDSQGRHVGRFLNAVPGLKEINSPRPFRYALEIPHGD